MDSMNPDQLSACGKKFFERIEFDENEQLHMEVRKDPFGLFLIYLSGAIATLIMFSILVLGGSMFDLVSFGDTIGTSGDSLRAIMIGVGFFMTLFAILVTAVAAYLYTNNVVLITSEKITQQLYLSLFNRKISQLSIADVQDVTVKQQGIFAHIFDYGTLTIETAGEQSNYTFTFTPKPYETAKTLVSAHEIDVSRHGN